MKDLGKTLRAEKIQNLKLREPLAIPHSTTLKDVLERMKAESRGYAVILKGKKVVGIFTERDALMRVAGQGPGYKESLSDPIEKFMTPDPKCLTLEASVADVIRLMSERSYRHVPLLNDKGELQATVGVRDLLGFLAEHFPYEVYNLPPNPQQVPLSAEGA